MSPGFRKHQKAENDGDNEAGMTITEFRTTLVIMVRPTAHNKVEREARCRNLITVSADEEDR